jgi:hypothetical protein
MEDNREDEEEVDLYEYGGSEIVEKYGRRINI